MKTKCKLLLTAMILAIFTACNNNLPDKNDPHYYECKQDLENASCQGNCNDGFGEVIIYDKNSVNLDSNELRTLIFDDSTRNKSIASYYFRACSPCKQIYRVKNKIVSCADYYSQLELAKRNPKASLEKIRSGF